MSIIQTPTVLIMAGGTGGHVYPALAVAEYLREQGVGVRWLGTERGLEARVVPAKDFVIDFISTVGVRGKGLWNGMKAPLIMLKGVWQCWQLIREVQPVAVLGMGGFVSVPGALASVLLRKPLLIHEQNSVAGSANRLLRFFAKESLQGFEGALPNAQHVGNPVRVEIAALHEQHKSLVDKKVINLFVLGGSLGAKAINDVLPAVLEQLLPSQSVQVWHQTGKTTYEQTLSVYKNQQVAQKAIESGQLKVSEYIEDMAEAYAWADIILCRAGAMTLAELSCAGLPALFVPLPQAIDNHQQVNAQYWVDHQAALLILQSSLSTESLLVTLTDLLMNRDRLQAMSDASKKLAPVHATQKVAEACLQIARDAEKNIEGAAK